MSAPSNVRDARAAGPGGPSTSGAAPDLRLVLPALAAWLVAWQARALPSGLVLTAAGVLALAGGLLLLTRREGKAAAVAAVLVCAAAAGVAVAARAAAPGSTPLRELAERGSSVTVVARLTDDPRLSGATPPGGQPLVIARVRVEEVSAGGQTLLLRAPVLVLTSETSWLGLLPSQQVRIEGRLLPARLGDDVAAVLSGRGPPEVLGSPSRLQRLAGHLRAGLRDAVSPLPDAEGGLLPGLVVGDTSRLLPEVKDDFRTVGLTHLTAVSGTNVSIVVGAALLLARRAGLGLRAGPALATAALLGFVVLARPSPSVLRAGVMGLVGLLALVVGGRRLAVPALAAAVLVLVLVAPDLAAQPGFALSVLATGGLLVLAPPWRDCLARRMPDPVAAALAVPAAAQVACGPVVVAISGELGLLSVPANLLAIPAVAPATVLGVACALLAPLWLPAAQVVAWVAWLPAAWLVLVARVGAEVPLSSLPWPDGMYGALLLTGLTGAAFVVLPRPGLRRGLAAALVAVAATWLLLGATAPSWPPPGWVLVACDVGQGDAVAVAAGAGAAVVVDAGPDPAAVDRCLDDLGVRRVPALVLTHMHADHVDGLPGVLEGRDVGGVQVNGLDEPELQAAAVLQEAAGAGLSVTRPAAGQVQRAGPVTWQVLGPVRRYRGTDSDPNNSSVVMRVEAAGLVLLLTGDIEPEAQRDLVRAGGLRADVLKVPHHGSARQDPAFLAAVSPRVALTSVGEDNTYGHPSPQVLGQLVEAGAQSWRTDLSGDLAVVVRDGELLVVPRRGGAPTPDPQDSLGPSGDPARPSGRRSPRTPGPGPWGRVR